MTKYSVIFVDPTRYYVVARKYRKNCSIQYLSRDPTTYYSRVFIVKWVKNLQKAYVYHDNNIPYERPGIGSPIYELKVKDNERLVEVYLGYDNTNNIKLSHDKIDWSIHKEPNSTSQLCPI